MNDLKSLIFWKIDFEKNHDFENQKNGFRTNLLLLVDFSFYISCVLTVIFHIKAVKTRKKIKISFWGGKS